MTTYHESDKINKLSQDRELKTKFKKIKKCLTNEQRFDKINKLQMSRDEKILRSDFIIDTGVDINKLRKSVVNLLGELK